MFEAEATATETLVETRISNTAADFRTPADPEAGWAARNPDRALLFLFVSPRACGALEELIAL